MEETLLGGMKGTNVKQRFPWPVKIAAKIVLSRLPLTYNTWARLGVFRHGRMDQFAYAYRVFKKHHDRIKPKPGFVCLELGPGDTVASALLTKAFGGSASYMVDVAEFAQADLKVYRDFAAKLRAQDLFVPDIENASSIRELLTLCDAEYLTQGLSSLQTIPNESVDFIYSHSCFEHIRLEEFLQTMWQLRRILRPGGGCSHRIDLQDHLGGALNSLRFSEKLWESNFMSNSGFYTNRLRFSEMKDLFEKAGFTHRILELDCWNELPTPKNALDGRFRNMDERELRINGFAVVLNASTSLALT